MPNEPRQNFGTRLPRALIDAIEARANTTGRTKTQIVEDALVAYFGLGEATEGTDVMQRLADVEQRLTNVERRLTENAQQRPTNVKHRPTVAQQPPNDAPEDSNAELHAPADGHPVADGLRWLSTGQAIVVSQRRNGPDNRATLMRWAREGRLDALGLRWIPHGSKRNDLATFEDLQHPPD
jgi:hypothetical protein